MRLSICVAVAFALLCSTQAQQPQSLTLDQAISMALKKNPSEEIAGHSVASAKQNLNSQGAPANPTVQYSGLNNSVAPFDGFGDSSNYALYLTLETSGRWQYRTDQARWEYVAAKYNAQGAKFGLVQSVTTAYVALQVAKADLQAEQESWNDIKKLADLSEQQFKLGAAPETNAIRASLALKQEDQNLVKAKAAVTIAVAALDNQLGIPPESTVDTADPLAYRSFAATLPALQQLARKNRFEILAGDATQKSLASAVNLNKANYFPDLLLGTDLQDRRLEVGFTIPIDLGSIKGSVSKAKEDAKVQSAVNEKQRQQVILDVQTAYYTLDQARQIVDSYKGDAVPQAQSLLDKVRQGYVLGASTILDVLDAQNTLRTMRAGYNDSLGAYEAALSQLQLSVGLPLERIEAKGITK